MGDPYWAGESAAENDIPAQTAASLDQNFEAHTARQGPERLLYKRAHASSVCLSVPPPIGCLYNLACIIDSIKEMFTSLHFTTELPMWLGSGTGHCQVRS